MNLYYFSMETYSKYSPGEDDDIISLYWQKINRLGEPSGTPVMLNSWEYGEKELLQKFHSAIQKSRWDFVPVGNNLPFFEKILKKKFKKHSMDFSGFEPSIDFRPIFVLMNRGLFAGSGLSDFASIESASNVRKWYTNKDFNKISSYVEQKAHAFLSIYQEAVRILSEYGMKRKKVKV